MIAKYSVDVGSCSFPLICWDLITSSSAETTSDSREDFPRESLLCSEFPDPGNISSMTFLFKVNGKWEAPRTRTVEIRRPLLFIFSVLSYQRNGHQSFIRVMPCLDTDWWCCGTKSGQRCIFWVVNFLIAVDSSRLYAIELQFSIFRVVLIVKEVYTLK